MAKLAPEFVLPEFVARGRSGSRLLVPEFVLPESNPAGFHFSVGVVVARLAWEQHPVLPIGIVDPDPLVGQPSSGRGQDLVGRAVPLEASHHPHRWRHHGHRTGSPLAEGLGRGEPGVVHDLALVVADRLILGETGHEEPGIEPPRRTDRSDESGHLFDRRDIEADPLFQQHVGEHPLVFQDPASNRGHGVPLDIPVGGQQNSGLLQGFAGRCDPPGQTPALNLEDLGSLIVGEATAQALEVVEVIVRVDPAAGKDPMVGGKDELGCPAHHQDLKIRAIIDQHHGGGRPDWNPFGIGHWIGARPVRHNGAGVFGWVWARHRTIVGATPGAGKSDMRQLTSDDLHRQSGRLRSGRQQAEPHAAIAIAERIFMSTRRVRLVALFLVTVVTGMIVGSSQADADDGVFTEAEAAELEAADFATIAALDELTSDHARLFRLYWAFFNRQPDPGGALYWIVRHDECLALDAIADSFAVSREFSDRYGLLDDTSFVETIYDNVLGRQADASGLAYWVAQLTTDRLSRGGVVLNVSLSGEFVSNHPYPSDPVLSRPCVSPAARAEAARRVAAQIEDPASVPLATAVGLTLRAPAEMIELAGFHQSSHPGALPMTAADNPIDMTVMASRGRGTVRTGALDVAVEPTATILSPVAGRVARAGSYTLYCRYRDGFVVINPDGRPDLEVKILHVQGVAVRAGQRVEVGQPVAANATTFPFVSQIDHLTGEPSWPHVHIEVVDPSIPRRPSSGSC